MGRKKGSLNKKTVELNLMKSEDINILKSGAIGAIGILDNTRSQNPIVVVKKKKVINKQRRIWFITKNNPDKNIIGAMGQLLNSSKWFYGQGETGKKGTNHIHICFHKKMRYKSVLKLFGLGTEVKVLDGKSKKDIRKAQLYCIKKDTYNASILKKMTKKDTRFLSSKSKISCIKKKDLYRWQKDLISYCCSYPNNRDIIYIVSSAGKGKSELQRYLCLKKNYLLIGGEKRHMLSQVYKGKKHNGYLYNATMRQGNRFSYDGFESIKDAHFSVGFGTKCNGQYIDNYKHLIVFSNVFPDEEKYHWEKSFIIDLDNYDKFWLKKLYKKLFGRVIKSIQLRR